MRHQLRFVQFAAIIFLAGVFSENAGAEHPDILRNYRLAPRWSTLDVSGGFAGIHQEYDLVGKFGLVTGFTQDPVIDSPLPVHVPYAQFVDVEIVALLNDLRAFAARLPLEQFVDLESLRSFYDTLPVLDFHGQDSQGAPFRLRAVQHGRLLHLRGQTGPVCCDFFHYEISALAYQVPFGDFNYDGRVGASDYTIWRDTFGSTTDLRADGNGDGVVDQADYDTWKADWGSVFDMSVPDDMFGDPSGLTAGAVPEPTSLALVALSGMPFIWRRLRLGTGQWC